MRPTVRDMQKTRQYRGEKSVIMLLSSISSSDYSDVLVAGSYTLSSHSAAYFVGYVEDEESVEMIEKKVAVW